MTDNMHGVLSCYAGLLVEDIRRVTDVYVRYGQYGFVRCRLFYRVVRLFVFGRKWVGVG